MLTGPDADWTRCWRIRLAGWKRSGLVRSESAARHFGISQDALFDMTAESPYNPPSEIPEPPADSETPPRMLRRGVTTIMVAVVWNVPFAVFLGLMLTGNTGGLQFPQFAVIWGGTIPISMLAVAWIPFVQRMLFVPEFDVKRMRGPLHGVAVLWTVLTVLGWSLVSS